MGIGSVGGGLVGGRFWLGEAADDFSIGDLPLLDGVGDTLAE